jgi:hypothetical protein
LRPPEDDDDILGLLLELVELVE